MNYNNNDVDFCVSSLNLLNEYISIRYNHLSFSGLNFSQLKCIIYTYVVCELDILTIYFLFCLFITIMFNIVDN